MHNKEIAIEKPMDKHKHGRRIVHRREKEKTKEVHREFDKSSEGKEELRTKDVFVFGWDQVFIGKRWIFLKHKSLRQIQEFSIFCF